MKDEINKYNELVLKYYKPKNNTVHFSSRQGEFNGVKDNTLEGIKLACKNGFEKIRLSINYTKDGVWVLTHDADITIEGTQYTINNTDYSVLQDYLVTLDEGIKLARKLSLIVQLEIKNATEDLIVEAWKIVARNMMHNNVIWNQWGNSINQWVNKIKSLQENAKLSISGAWSLDLIEKAHALQNARNEVIIGIYPPSEPTEEQILKVAEYGLETIVSSVYNISQLVEAISYANEIETSNMIMPVSGLIDDGLNN